MAELTTEARLYAHEEVCAARYEGIMQRVGRIEMILIGCAGALILQLLGVIGYLFTRVSS
jgi:hypothetical protein